jgi:protein-S-isoprenylcysteine O-methyltransferase Ste14
MDGALLAAIFGLGWIPLFAFRAESMSDALPYYAAAERRWVKLSPAIVATHVTLSCLLVSLSEPPPWRAALGVSCFVIALAFWFWARAQIGPLRATRLPEDRPRELRRDGPFALVRNPLYLGYLVAAAAPAIVAAQPVLLLTFAACFAGLATRAAQEEARLHRQLGAAYADYCRQVKRLIPFVW